MKCTKLVALALVAMLLVLAVSCEPEKEVIPTKLAVACTRCRGTHEIDIEGCTDWGQVVEKNSGMLSFKTGSVYYSYNGCYGGVAVNDGYYNIHSRDTIDYKAPHSIKD